MIRRLAVFLLATGALAQPESLRVGEIEFYGYAGLDLNAKRAMLPLKEGDEVSPDQMEGLIDRIKQAVHTTSVGRSVATMKRA